MAGGLELDFHNQIGEEQQNHFLNTNDHQQTIMNLPPLSYGASSIRSATGYEYRIDFPPRKSEKRDLKRAIDQNEYYFFRFISGPILCLLDELEFCFWTLIYFSCRYSDCRLDPPGHCSAYRR